MRTMITGTLIALAVLATPAQAQDEVPRAKPIGSPGAWIPPGSYPEMAKRSAEEGRVSFMLDIDETGHVSDCKITKTSDSPLLDETTCALMTANGRFEIARDKKNKPTPSRWGSTVTWKLETPPPEPVAPAGSPPTTLPPPVTKPAPGK